jgi:hypothetical protein
MDASPKACVMDLKSREFIHKIEKLRMSLQVKMIHFMHNIRIK